MTRDDALQLMSYNLHRLLCLMFHLCRRWMPNTDYPRRSAGLSCGGVVGYENAEAMEDEVDVSAARVLETYFFESLTIAERTVIEVALGLQPDVWTVRPDVAAEAVRKLEKKLQEIGAA